MANIRVGISPFYSTPECFPIKMTRCSPGPVLEILDAMTIMANLSVTFVMTNVTGCGRDASGRGSGNSTGLYRLLLDNKIDMTGNICHANSVMTRVNPELISASWPVWQFTEQYIIKAPNPPPLSFMPFAPFRWEIWMVQFLIMAVYVSFMMIYSKVKYGSSRKFGFRIFNAICELMLACFRMRKPLPSAIIWPMWVLFWAFMFNFYNSYILRAVMYPHALWPPFDDAESLSQALISGKYRLISHKDPPEIPAGCTNRPCSHIFNQAMKKNGFEFMPKSKPGQILSMISDQDINAYPKYVLIKGKPFMALLLNEYKGDRERLWVMDAKDHYETISSFMWRKDFAYAHKLNVHLNSLGDYKILALMRNISIHNGWPKRGDRIVEKVTDKDSISLINFQGLFYMHFIGLCIAAVAFIVELKIYPHGSYGL